MKTERRRKWQILGSAAMLGIGVPAILNLRHVLSSLPRSMTSGVDDLRENRVAVTGRRSLRQSSSPWDIWARDHLVAVDKTPDATLDMPLFWHIPKSGGTTVKKMFLCSGLSMAGRDEFIDVYSHSGILRAKEMGVVTSRMVDIVTSSSLTAVGKDLFDDDHKGRAFAVFRHPVERIISKFYYLQQASWEKSYRPEWKELTLMEWILINNGSGDSNLMVHRIMNKALPQPIDKSDLVKSAKFLRRRVIIGLTDQMEESMRRFYSILALDKMHLEKANFCMEEFFSPKESKRKHLKMNANEHPEFDESSPEWKAIAEWNKYDIMLYKIAIRLFNEQKALFDSRL